MTTLKIYQTNITPERNALIDNLDNYLATCHIGWSNDNYQTQKIELNKDFVINIPQDIYEPQPLGNYLVLNQISKNYYYFIIGYEWTSVNSCRIQCVMDTVNTYKNSLVWSNKTQINREFRDRFAEKKNATFMTPIDKLSYGSMGEYIYNFSFKDPLLVNATLIDVEPIITQGTGHADLIINDKSINPETGGLDIYCNIITDGPTSTSFQFKITYDATVRVIDKINEGITPVLYGTEGPQILDKGDSDSWYVVYNTEYTEGQTTEKDSGYISTLLCKDGGFTAKISSSVVNEAILTPSKLEEGLYYVVDLTDLNDKYRLVSGYDTNNHEIIKVKEYTKGEAEQTTYWLTDIGFYKEGNAIYVEEVNMERQKTGLGKKEIVVNPITSLSSFKLKSDKDFVIYKYPTRIYSQFSNALRDEIRACPTLPVDTSKETVYINSFDEVDTTQASLVKIIKFPYCPIDYTIDSDGIYVFNSLIGKDVNEKLKATLLTIPKQVKFGHTIDNNVKNPFLIKEQGIITGVPSPNDMKDMANESKLYHSEFYNPRIVYDSFVKDFDLEKITTTEDVSNTLNIEYKPSRVFNSSFMFTFPEYKTSGMQDENYNNVLICNRNNEVPIYSSQYLNYVRNGYNYDVKNKNAAIAQTWTQLGLQVGLGGIGLGALNAMAPYRGDYNAVHVGPEADSYWNNLFVQSPKGYAEKMRGLANNAINEGNYTKDKMKFARGSKWKYFGAGLTVAAGVTNAVINTVQTERNLKQKLNDLRASAMSVSGIDDIDLLEEYSGNKAKLMIYGLSKQAKEAIYNLFYYLGYNTNRKDVPNFNTRYWFNYIQCDPVFDTYQNVYDEFLDDIKKRFNEGITVYHEHNGQYDWNQEHENWENWLIK